MQSIFTKLYLLSRRDSGQTMAEYAVVLTVIAITVFVALGVLSGSISGVLDTVTAEL
jgi:Flp pilus assembly pilin Flp